MPRLFVFGIALLTVFTTLSVAVIQPYNVSVRKKRLKDMRQFLLAQTPPPPPSPPPSGGGGALGPLSGETCPPGNPCEGGAGGNAPLSVNPEVRGVLLKVLEESLFGVQFGVQYGGISNVIHNKINEMVACLDKINPARFFGGNDAELNGAWNTIFNATETFVQKTPATTTGGIEEAVRGAKEHLQSGIKIVCAKYDNYDMATYIKDPTEYAAYIKAMLNPPPPQTVEEKTEGQKPPETTQEVISTVPQQPAPTKTPPANPYIQTLKQQALQAVRTEGIGKFKVVGKKINDVLWQVRTNIIKLFFKNWAFNRAGPR